MRFLNGLHVSDSLWNMMSARRQDSECLRLLVGGLDRMREGASRFAYDNSGGHYIPARAANRIINSKLPGNYFSFREKEGMISYMPRGKEQVITEDGTWAREGRQSMKPARWIRSMLNPKLANKVKDNVFAEFNNIVLHEELRGKVFFKLVSVAEGYDKANFARVESCMWGKDVAPFYDAFRCQVIVAYQKVPTISSYKNVWIGRALVWPDVEVTPTDQKMRVMTFMDRVYSSSPEVAMAFLQYAKDQEWIHKTKQTKEYGSFVVNGKEVNAFLKASVTAGSDLDRAPFYPYCDTMLCGKDDWVASDDSRGFQFTYRYTDGRRTKEAPPGRVMGVRGLWIDEENAVQVEGGGWYSEDDDAICQCRVSGVWMVKSKAYYINYEDGIWVSPNQVWLNGNRSMSVARTMRGAF